MIPKLFQKFSTLLVGSRANTSHPNRTEPSSRTFVYWLEEVAPEYPEYQHPLHSSVSFPIPRY
jgi:hypothetical protein